IGPEQRAGPHRTEPLQQRVGNETVLEDLVLDPDTNPTKVGARAQAPGSGALVEGLRAIDADQETTEGPPQTEAGILPIVAGDVEGRNRSPHREPAAQPVFDLEAATTRANSGRLVEIGESPLGGARGQLPLA